MTPNSKVLYLDTFAFNDNPSTSFRYVPLDTLINIAYMAKQQPNKDLYYRLMTYLLISIEWYEAFVTYSYADNAVVSVVNVELFKQFVDNDIPPEAFVDYFNFVNIVSKLLNKSI